MQRIKMPVSSGNNRTRRAPTQKGDGLKLAGEGRFMDDLVRNIRRDTDEKVNRYKMLAARRPAGMHGSGGVFDFVKSIAGWLFGSRTSKGKEDAKAEPDIAAALSECEELLAAHGVTDMKSWRKFALKHHPDKGGDSELFARVSNCVDKHIKGSGNASKLLKLLKKANVKGLD